ncbi:hypothetical protein [Undibacterium sp. TC9W]|uniref:hypothetical protein n=1 Tax=Undibacterium sp. TC9W TaxID=3413053 RepID=UPI003BF11C45
MLQAIGTIISLIIGFFVWKFTTILGQILGQGIYPFGATGKLEYVIFFGPIVFFAFPIAILSIIKKSPAKGFFILAISPILGFMNFIPLFIITYMLTKIFRHNPYIDYYSVLLCQLIWVCIFWVNLKLADNGPKPENRTLSNQETKKAKDYSRILQVIGLAYACFIAYFLFKL